MNPIQYNPYTNPVWKAALQQYESFLKPAEQRIGQKLKGQLKAMQENVLQASFKHE
jgi:dynein heavy chain 2